MNISEKSWKEDKRFSDRFLPEIKSILGKYLFTEIPKEDIYHNTDLVVLELTSVRVACRVRRYKYFERYKHQFTIRKSRPSGVKSELTKILEGWGDYFFYGFSDEEEETLCFWSLCDLNTFRLWFSRELVKLPFGKYPGDQRVNNDNSSDFLVFNFADLPDDFIVARSRP